MFLKSPLGRPRLMAVRQNFLEFPEIQEFSINCVQVLGLQAGKGCAEPWQRNLAGAPRGRRRRKNKK